jgi:polyisoprenoid-binding protein YceI
MRRTSHLLIAVGASALAALAHGAHAQTYAIDAAASDIHWLVYKAGTLERLGHNHVISVPTPQGNVTLDAGNESNSRFLIEIPVSDLVVDQPELRKPLGEPFASVPTAEDVAGTRKNMLSDRVLQADQHPTIKITGTGPIGPPGSQQLKLTVELLGRTIPLTVPTKITIGPDAIDAEGQFELTHSELGMKPFSVMLGALQVADRMTFVYRVHARPVAVQ